MKKWQAVFFLCLFLGTVSSRVWAAEAQQDGVEVRDTAKEIQVSPVRFDWNLVPGEVRSGVISLKNYAEGDYKINIAVEDFYVSDDSLQANFYVPTKDHPLAAYDVINWVVPEEKEFVMKGGEARSFKFTVTVPNDAPTGGYYGGIFIQHEKVKKDNEPDGSRMDVKTRAGVLLVFGVQGTDPAVRMGKMEKVTSDKWIYFDNPVKVTADVTNAGNMQYKMSGNMDISRFGKEIAKRDVNQSTVYPGKLRHFNSDWNFSLLDFGRYKAKVNLTSVEGDVIVVGETAFWVFPWKTMAAVAGVIAFLWIIYKLGGRKERKKTDRK